MQMAYKAFSKDLHSMLGGRRIQFRPGEWFEEKEANAGANGFHCALDPLDCLDYYGKWESSSYWIVFADGDINEKNRGTALSCTRVRLIHELTLEEFISEAINFIMEHPRLENNRRVMRGTAAAGKEDKFVIVRGKMPAAKGHIGQFLGFAQEKVGSRDIEYASILYVDGRQILPDTWYYPDGKVAHPAGEEAPA